MKMRVNKKYLISICVLLIVTIFYFNKVKGDDKVTNVWEPFSNWYEWKKTTELTEAQKAVIDYFDAATKTREKAQSNNVKNLSPDEAIKIIESSITMLGNTAVPKSCRIYNDALLQELKIELEYQQAKKAGASSDALHKITLKILAIDGKKFTAFFNAIEEVGLFDNIEEEMKNIED